ncbi:hypothetical protein [Streptomyces sp. NPDC046862]|uniref:DUF6197 family protein n=1 Tax=Streptomyces sp. NPDC046862 TaxID=3154603 RepID=UPI003453CCB9
MHGTDLILNETARIIDFRGLHTGHQFAANTGRRATLEAPLDICAAVYLATTGQVPDTFFTDEGTSRELIEASPAAMDAIRAISAAIRNYEVPDTDGRPDVIEHVSQWTFTNPIGCTQPPSTSEVIGCILRAAKHAAHTNASAA